MSNEISELSVFEKIKKITAVQNKLELTKQSK